MKRKTLQLLDRLWPVAVVTTIFVLVAIFIVGPYVLEEMMWGGIDTSMEFFTYLFLTGIITAITVAISLGALYGIYYLIGWIIFGNQWSKKAPF